MFATLVFIEIAQDRHIPACVGPGDFRQLVYAMRQDITYTVTTTGVITDASGQIIYNLFQQDMTAMRVVMRMGWQLPNPPNWIKQTDSDTSRYPFAVLKP